MTVAQYSNRVGSRNRHMIAQNAANISVLKIVTTDVSDKPIASLLIAAIRTT